MPVEIQLCIIKYTSSKPLRLTDPQNTFLSLVRYVAFFFLSLRSIFSPIHLRYLCTVLCKTSSSVLPSWALYHAADAWNNNKKSSIYDVSTTCTPTLQVCTFWSTFHSPPKEQWGTVPTAFTAEYAGSLNRRSAIESAFEVFFYNGGRFTFFFPRLFKHLLIIKLAHCQLLAESYGTQMPRTHSWVASKVFSSTRKFAATHCIREGGMTTWRSLDFISCSDYSDCNKLRNWSAV